MVRALDIVAAHEHVQVTLDVVRSDVLGLVMTHRNLLNLGRQSEHLHGGLLTQGLVGTLSDRPSRRVTSAAKWSLAGWRFCREEEAIFG